MGGKIYHRDTIEICTRAELNVFGKRYHEIMVETGRGAKPKDRANGQTDLVFVNNRTDEQNYLVSRIITSMLPALEDAAKGLLSTGYYKSKFISFPLTLSGIAADTIPESITRADVIHEGAGYAAEKFPSYDPSRSNTKDGSVYSFILM